VKIPVKDIDNFLKKIPKEIKSILLYGPDLGLVSERVNQIEKNYALAGKFRYDQLKSNPYVALDSLRSIDLFNNSNSKEKLIIIDMPGATIAEPLVTILKDGKYTGLIVLAAGDLASDSSIRKLFEKPIANIAAVPCYVEDQQTVARYIVEQFKINQISSEPGLVQQLSSFLELGNHALIKREIEKLILFLGDKKHLKLQDIEQYYELSGEISFDKLSYNISLKQVRYTDRLVDKLQNEGHNLVSIIRFVSRHFFRLYQVKSLIEHGKTETTAMSSLQPPVFFKQVADFNKSLQLWKVRELAEFLGKLNGLELLAKQNPSLANIALRKAFLEVV
jgi:DNA polymerase III subunit delta